MLNSILVVDDDPQIIQLASIGLKATHPELTIYTAQNGRQAIREVCSVKPNLMLIDLRMPELDGEEVVKQLRESDNEGADLPVVFFTGKPRDVSHVEGCLGTIEKPFDPLALGGELQRLVVGAEAARGGQTPEE
ncbi:MAG: response regulator [Pseudomonadota bacterium]